LPADIEVVLVIIDTLARSLGGKDENGEGARNFLDNAEELADRLKCLVLAVHHEGAGDSDRPRGATALPAGVVAQWHLKRQGNGDGLRCRLVVDEAKDSVSKFEFDVTLERFEFGDDHDERRESTLLVKSIKQAEGINADDPGKSRRGAGPPKSMRALTTSMDIALDRFGIELRLPNSGPKVKAVKVALVRSTYFGKRADLEGRQQASGFSPAAGTSAQRGGAGVGADRGRGIPMEALTRQRHTTRQTRHLSRFWRGCPHDDDATRHTPVGGVVCRVSVRGPVP
jgi:hypothetical protein